MRILLIVVLGILLCAATLLVVLATVYSTRHQQAAPIPAELPDLVKFDSEDQKRSFRLEEARSQLKYITEKYDDTFLARANCEVVEARLEQEYEDSEAAPMMIASSLVAVEDENQYFLFVWCFNPHREADAIVLLGETPEGTIVRVRYESKPQVKCGLLVTTFGGKPRLVSLDELFEAGEVLRSNGEIEVRISTETLDVPLVPDLPVLAVALHDRNGKLSNFVSVRRDKVVNKESGTIETVEEAAERSSGDENESPK